MNPRVTHVTVGNGYELEITFSNGEVRRFDCAPLLDHGVFRELADMDYFRMARAAHGTVIWPNGQDICPDTLYEGSAPMLGRAQPARGVTS